MARVRISLWHRAARGRKFASSCLPSGVRTDSGGIGRRSAGRARWRTAITTSPSEAVRSSSAGQLRVGDQRVIAPAVERVRQPGEDARSVVVDLGVLAVDRLAADRRARRTPRPSPGGRGRRRASGSPPRRTRATPRSRSRPRRACTARARSRAGPARARATRRPSPCRCARPRPRRRARPGTGRGCR